MYVVRYIDAGLPDFKAFDKRPDAEKRFHAARAHVWENALESVSIFEVPSAHDARDAVEAVKSGQKDRVTLIDTEPRPLPELDVSMLDDLPDADAEGTKG